MNESAVPKVNIGGTGISNITLPETITLLDKWITEKNKKRICVTPVNCVVWAAKNQLLKDIYNSADLTLCDGVPLLWASRFLGKGRLRGRVTGLDLLPAFIERCYEKNYSMFFLGAAENVALQLQEKLERNYPGIRISGVYSPPYADKFSDEENQKIIQLINQADPDIVWVSLTAPKQDFWIYEYGSQLTSRITIGIGGALDVAAGRIKRAPVWMQRNGLEWFYRFSREPKRLFRRYFIEAPAIFGIVLKQKFNKN